ncbi:MAG TPA: hypothetical protein VHU81_13185 [Thermoanaerobaculia bacterium]|nr:hypothetical protein [Thermoanaerobaculia bacterium]
MDSILYWNDVALEANRVSHSDGSKEQNGPTLSSRALAIVHLAMYDAYAGVVKSPNLPPYLQGLPAPAPGASAQAAVAAAAHTTLSALFPSQKAYFDRQYQAAGITGDAHPIRNGYNFGQLVARTLLKDRKDDPGAGDQGYAPSLARGAHRPDPDNPDQGFHGPFYGTAKLFASAKRWDLDQPPSPTHRTTVYNDALRQVRALGIAPELTGTLPAGPKRSATETLVGIYWGYDGAKGLGTPPRFYNQIVRKVAEAQKNKEEDNARLFAFVNAAMADAGILAWQEKYRWDLWRPVVGVREEDPSMGPTGTGGDTLTQDCDPNWLPLGAPSTNVLRDSASATMAQFPSQQANALRVKNFTPPFPAYPSGHATFGAAAFQITRLFYKVKPGDRNPDKLFDNLTLVSEEFNGENRDNRGTVRPRHVRKFPKGLWGMIVENSFSRVLLGVHWVFDGFLPDSNGDPVLKPNDRVGGVQLGLDIAEDIFAAGGGKAPKRSTV